LEDVVYQVDQENDAEQDDGDGNRLKRDFKAERCV